MGDVKVAMQMCNEAMSLFKTNEDQELVLYSNVILESIQLEYSRRESDAKEMAKKLSRQVQKLEADAQFSHQDEYLANKNKLVKRKEALIESIENHKKSIAEYKESFNSIHQELKLLQSELLQLEKETECQLPRLELWHQLTEAVISFINNEELSSMIDLVEFYNILVLDFASHMNQLSLCQIAFDVFHHIQDQDEKLTFLNALASATHIIDDPEAHIMANSFLAQFQVKAGLMDEALGNLDVAEGLLSNLQTADSSVHGAYYKARACYLKHKQDMSGFYVNGLQYLAYAKVDDVVPQERTELAHDLCIAALTGENIFNFGELLNNQLLQYLQSTPHKWLGELVEIFNRGDLDGWQRCKIEHGPLLALHFADGEAMMDMKIATLSVIEMLFNKHSSERNISFQEIANVSRISEDQVELLLMHALRLELIKGKIDQTNKMVNITWVFPRVLTENQVAAMQDRLENWSGMVKMALNLVENQMTPELIS